MKQASLQERIYMLRGMFLGGGAWIYAIPPEEYELELAKSGLNVPADSFGFLTNQNRLTFNVGQVPITRHGIQAFVRTPEVTTLFGPTFSDALNFGFYCLVCNLAAKPGVLTQRDVLQQAIEIGRRAAKDKLKNRGNDFEPHLSTENVENWLNIMRRCGAGTPIVPIINRIHTKLNLRKFSVAIVGVLCGILGYSLSSWLLALATAVLLMTISYMSMTRLLSIGFKSPAKASPLEHTLLFSDSEVMLNPKQKDYQLMLRRSDTTFRITSGSLASTLSVAKMLGWHGGNNFFYEAQNGMRGVKIVSRLILSDNDAKELAPILRQYAHGHSEPTNSYIIDMENLAAFFSSGGCEVLFH